MDFKAILDRQHARLKNFAVLLLSNFFTAGIGFLTTVMIANSLGSAVFGELAYAYAVGGVLAVNVRFGMDQSLIRDLSHYPERLAELLASSILLRVVLFCIVLSGFLILKTKVFIDPPLSIGSYLVILATLLAPFQIANLFDLWEKQGRHALYMLVERSIYFLIVWGVVIVAPEQLSVLWIGIALILAAIVFLILQYTHAWKYVRSSVQGLGYRKLISVSITLLKSNKWLWIASVATLGTGALTNIILKQISGSAALGVFMASFQIITLGSLLLKNTSRIGRPIMARQTAPQNTSNLGDFQFLLLYILLVWVVMSVIALPAIIFPEFILKTLFIPEYASGYLILRLLGVYLYVRTIEFVLGQYLVLSRKDKTYLATRVISGLASLIFAFMLVPKYSGIGAAFSILAGVVIGTVLCIGASVLRIGEVRGLASMNGVSVEGTKSVQP